MLRVDLVKNMTPQNGVIYRQWMRFGREVHWQIFVDHMGLVLRWIDIPRPAISTLHEGIKYKYERSMLHIAYRVYLWFELNQACVHFFNEAVIILLLTMKLSDNTCQVAFRFDKKVCFWSKVETAADWYLISGHLIKTKHVSQLTDKS